MKIVLINPPSISGKMAFISSQHPLNIAIIAAYLREKSKNYDLEIWDFYNVEDYSDKIFIDKLKKSKPKIIGFSCMTPTIKKSHEMAKIVKTVLPNSITIVGGCHVSAIPERTIEEFPFFNLIVYGEGELTLEEICKKVQAGKKLEGIKGTAYKKDKKVIVEKPRELIKNLDEIPFPARDLLKLDQYKGNVHRGFSSDVLNILQIITARGCPGRCIFCASRVIYGNTVRFRSAENVIQEIKECKEKYGINHVMIVDDTFTLNAKRMYKILDYLKENKFSWNCWARVDCVNEEMIKKMAESGCKSVQFGVENGSPEMLKLLKKNITVEQIRKAFAWAKKYGLPTDATIVLGGHPAESKETIKSTIKLIKELNPEIFSAGVLAPYPGTEVYSMLKEKNYLKDEDWDNYVQYANKFVNYKLDNLTSNDLRKVQDRILRNFYFKPTFIFKKLSEVRNFKELKYLFSIGSSILIRVVLGLKIKSKI